MTRSMLVAADRAKNGSNSAFKFSAGTTTAVFDADGQDVFQDEANGNLSCRQVRTLDYTCIM
jgi:hypothetical protein